MRLLEDFLKMNPSLNMAYPWLDGRHVGLDVLEFNILAQKKS